MNKMLLICMSFFTSIGVYGNDSILVDKVWTERQTIFVNVSQADSILDDSVTEYNGIGCGPYASTIIRLLRASAYRLV